MLSRVRSMGLNGIRGYEVSVECYITNGLPGFEIVGLPDAAVKEAVVRNGAVYLAALGGAGALMAQSVKTLEVIAWPDLGCEAVRRLTVEKMPLTVILDAHGGDLYTSGPAAYLETVK